MNEGKKERMVEWVNVSRYTVDGRNPAPVDMVNISLFTRFYTSQVPGGAGFLPSTVRVHMNYITILCSIILQFSRIHLIWTHRQRILLLLLLSLMTATPLWLMTYGTSFVGCLPRFGSVGSLVDQVAAHIAIAILLELHHCLERCTKPKLAHMVNDIKTVET